MQEWQTDMEEKLRETHDMVKEIRDIVVGSENYKDQSMVHRMGKYEDRMKEYEEKIKKLEDDRLQRETSVKTTKSIMRILYVVIAALVSFLGYVMNYVFSHFVK